MSVSSDPANANPLVRLRRSVATHGVLGTARLAIRTAARPFARPHILQHLEVPIAMLRRPGDVVPWVRDRFGAGSPVRQSLPWIAWPCVDFLQARLGPNSRVFEWGGGGSTIFLLKLGCQVTTIESSEEWVEQLRARVSELGPEASRRWDLRFVPVTGNEDPNLAQYIAEVERGAPWDLVMVDGWGRLQCLRHGKAFVAKGGILVLDNADQAQFITVPRELAHWDRHALRGLGVARSWVTQTDAYVNR